MHHPVDAAHRLPDGRRGRHSWPRPSVQGEPRTSRPTHAVARPRRVRVSASPETTRTAGDQNVAMSGHSTPPGRCRQRVCRPLPCPRSGLEVGQRPRPHHDEEHDQRRAMPPATTTAIARRRRRAPRPAARRPRRRRTGPPRAAPRRSRRPRRGGSARARACSAARGRRDEHRPQRRETPTSPPTSGRGDHDQRGARDGADDQRDGAGSGARTGAAARTLSWVRADQADSARAEDQAELLLAQPVLVLEDERGARDVARTAPPSPARPPATRPTNVRSRSRPP